MTGPLWYNRSRDKPKNFKSGHLLVQRINTISGLVILITTKLKENFQWRKGQTYSSEIYSSAWYEQVPGSTKLVADLWPRLTTNLANEAFGKWCHDRLYECTKCIVIGLGNFSEHLISGKTRICQHFGSRVALYHDLHTSGILNRSDSIPTHLNTSTRQSMFKFCHSLWAMNYLLSLRK